MRLVLEAEVTHTADFAKSTRPDADSVSAGTPVTCSASQRYSAGTSSLGQAFEQRLVSFEEPLGPGREVLVGSDSVDLRAQRVDDELIDTRPPDAGNGLRLVG